MNEPLPVTLSDSYTAPQRRAYGTIAAWLFCVFLAAGVIGVGFAVLRDDGFFGLGFVGVYSATLLIALPACAILASVSLIRHEPCFRRSLTVLLLSLLILAGAGSFAYRWLSTPLRLFQ